MPQLYDLGYKKLFSNKILFQQLIESFIPFSWVKEIDFENCELMDKSFISEHYKKRESDVVYKVKFKDKTAYIVILLEFQSSNSKFMVVRVLHYITSFYMRLIESDTDKIDKLPSVFPIVLYNGLKKWTAPIHIQELIENHELLGEYGLQFKYFKIAENEISVEKLKTLSNAVATLFLGEVQQDRALFVHTFESLLNVEDKQVISLLYNYFQQLFNHDKMTEVDWNNLEKAHDEREVNMFLENMKVWKDIAYQEGMHVGELKGVRKTAKTMLIEGLDMSLIAKVTGLSTEEIDKIKQEIIH